VANELLTSLNGLWYPGAIDDGPGSYSVYALNVDWNYSHSTGSGDCYGVVLVPDKDYVNADVDVSVFIDTYSGSPEMYAEVRNSWISGANPTRPDSTVSPLGVSPTAKIPAANTAWHALDTIPNVSMDVEKAYFVEVFCDNLSGDSATVVTRGELDGLGAVGTIGGTTFRGFTEDAGFSGNYTETIGNPIIAISIDGTPFGFVFPSQITRANNQDYRGNSYIFDSDVYIDGMRYPSIDGPVPFDTGTFGIWPSDSATEIVKVTATASPQNHFQGVRWPRQLIEAGQEVHIMCAPASNSTFGDLYEMGTNADSNSVVSDCGWYQAHAVEGTLGSIVSMPYEWSGMCPMVSNVSNPAGSDLIVPNRKIFI